MTTKPLEPIHPGEILEEEFMLPLRLSANALARRIDVPVTRISEIVRGKRGITADTALRLARLFGTTSDLWLGLQAEYDLRLARKELPPAALSRIVPMKRRESGYAENAPQSASEVGEPVEPYGGGTADRRGHDRRRRRRASLEETISILSDPTATKKIARVRREIASDIRLTHEQVWRKDGVSTSLSSRRGKGHSGSARKGDRASSVRRRSSNR
jgi:addiction module HigA family antidote